MTPVMTAQDLNAFMKQVFQQVADEYTVDHVGPGTVTMRLLTSDKHLRPGGTISGPTMFSLADVAAYIVTLAHIGPQALAVTTNGWIDVMRKPQADVPLVSHARLLKLGKHLSVSDVMLYSDGQEAPVARASLTYSIPPKPTPA